jgi:hypothetical protein
MIPHSKLRNYLSVPALLWTPRALYGRSCVLFLQRFCVRVYTPAHVFMVSSRALAYEFAFFMIFLILGKHEETLQTEQEHDWGGMRALMLKLSYVGYCCQCTMFTSILFLKHLQTQTPCQALDMSLLLLVIAFTSQAKCQPELGVCIWPLTPTPQPVQCFVSWRVHPMLADVEKIWKAPRELTLAAVLPCQWPFAPLVSEHSAF